MEKLNILLYKRAKKLYCYIANIRMNFYLVCFLIKFALLLQCY